MASMERPSFDTRDRERLYEYIERNGPVPREELFDRSIVRVDPQRCKQLIAIMKRDGYLVETGGMVQVSSEVQDATEEEYSKDEYDFSIRKARHEDLSGVIGVIRQVAEDGRYIEAESVAEQIDHDQALIRHNELTSRVFYVATVNNEVVGWCHVESSDVAKLSHTAELTTGLLDEYRGEGIGSHLLQRGVGWAAKRGYEKVYQSLPATNEGGITFLMKNGWYEEARRENHYRVDGEPVDEVMMAITIE